jgi:hypothetical protein
MGDPDVRNALARRLQRNISDASQSSKPDASSISVNHKLPRPTASVPTAAAPKMGVIDVMAVRVSGFLYKYSSGHLARWQKRYFVLDCGRLSYFKKAPSEKDSPNKAFSIRKIKSVVSKDSVESDDREFSLVFASGKTYQMRAPTNDDMRKWVTTLRAALAYLESTGPDADQHADDLDALSDADGMTSAQASVTSENRPPDSPTQSSEHKLSARLHGLIPRRESISGVLHAAGHGLSTIKHAVVPITMTNSPVDTSMLEVEIDPDQLDKNFEEWFYFVQTDSGGVQIQRDIKMGNITDACGKANQHLWSTLANLPKGSEVKLEEAVGRARSRMGAPEAVDRAAIIVEEYLMRLSKYVMKSVDLRNAILHSGPRLGHGKTTLGLGSIPNIMNPTVTVGGLCTELPQLMDCMTKISGLLEKLLPHPQGAPKCICCYCDPSGVGMLKLERQQGGKKTTNLPPVACSPEKWRKCMRGILQRLGGELEVGLIEELQNLIQSAELAWESPARLAMPTDDNVFGPCPQQHPLLDDLFVNPTPGVKSAAPKILMSSFASAFVQAAQSRCLNSASQWMAAYPPSARLISEHSSSALVASLNSVWRQFKRVASHASERAHQEQTRKYTESIRNSRDEALRSSVSSAASSPRNRKRSLGEMNETLFDLEHLVSFTNECILVSRFCAKTWSNGVSAKFTPEVFLSCMDGLASGLLSTAVDVCHSVVILHYLPRVKFDLNKMFFTKNLSHNHSTPMVHGKLITEQFVSSVDVLFPLACVRDAIVTLLGPCLMRSYMRALFRNHPKLKTFKTVPEMVRGDIDTFKELFVVGFKVPGHCLERTMTITDALIKTLTDKNRINYSIHFNSLAQMLSSRKEAFAVIQSVLKMREHEWTSSADKKDIVNIVNNIKAEMTSEKADTDEDVRKEESVVKKLPKGAVSIYLGVGELKVPWKFDD